MVFRVRYFLRVILCVLFYTFYFMRVIRAFHLKCHNTAEQHVVTARYHSAMLQYVVTARYHSAMLQYAVTALIPRVRVKKRIIVPQNNAILR